MSELPIAGANANGGDQAYIYRDGDECKVPFPVGFTMDSNSTSVTVFPSVTFRNASYGPSPETFVFSNAITHSRL